MAYPIKKCVVCGDEFELKPDKPGFANRCPDCTEAEMENDAATRQPIDTDDRRSSNEQNEARRNAMRDLLYRKDS